MKKIAIILFPLIFTIGSITILPTIPDMEVYANQGTWSVDEFTMDMNISQASRASFLGEKKYDFAGMKLSGVGDVNGDGFDDILINAYYDDGNWNFLGKTYLIFGKSSGWTMDVNISTANASFVAEGVGDHYYMDISGAGDVNGDGYDDILIGARMNDDNGPDTGQAYLIFGKSSGWINNMSLANADASFRGVSDNDYTGSSVSGAGDVNGDGIDDFLISSSEYDTQYAGKVSLFFGKKSGWTMDTDISMADASFMGESANDHADIVSEAGDVNEDGYDDILIGANGNSEVRRGAGQAYLIFGKSSGWSKNVNISNSDASFIGENIDDCAGESIQGAGDVNGDGFDDILIGARSNDDGGPGAGQSYLIFGKSSGWSMDTDLSNADASFIGENSGDHAIETAGAGDVNGDGYDDILIGAWENDENGIEAGQTYLIYGRKTGWTMDTDLSNVDASFIGESKLNGLGKSLDKIGDVNNDGLDDILIGSHWNDEKDVDAGQVYLIMGIGITDPLEVYSIRAYSDSNFLHLVDTIDLNEKIFIEMVGLDGNESKRDRCLVNLVNNITYLGIKVRMEETGFNTGIYRGEYTVAPPFSYLEKIVIFSNVNQTIKTEVLVHTPVQIRPRMESFQMPEDVMLWIEFSNFGYNPIEKWEMNTNSNWAQWNNNERILTGTPYNLDVGTWWVNISVEDEFENRDFLNITIEVLNEPPKLSYLDKLEATEDIPFEYDFDCDDELFGGVTWDISPSNIGWLDLNVQTGVLSGTPLNGDDGTFEINISAEDEHRGISWVIFDLIVHDVNDPPVITTEPISEVYQGQNYYVQFNAIDEDDINTYEWTMDTDAQFLEIHNQTGIVTGTPDNEDVGTYFVNISAMDLRGEEDWLEFDLEVIDVNDAPTWSTTPSDTQIEQGIEYTFTTEAIDVDIDDTIRYSISSYPSSDITIDGSNGGISWIGSLNGLTPNPNHVLNVQISASDGKETITHGFTITVIPNPSPTSTIIGPNDGTRVTYEGILLEWEGNDDGEEPLIYDIYLGDSNTHVSMLERNVLWKEDVEGTSIHTGELERGKTYYWTVIPKDIYSSGICTNDIFSFSVNIPPSIQEFTVPEAKIGVEFRLSLSGSDLNGDDLEIALVEGPSGMEIFDGMISWVPSESQVGTHTVNVSLSDGYETIYDEFEVEVPEKEIVSEPDEKGSPIVLIIIIIIIILILIGVGIGAFLYLKKKGESDSEEEKEETPPEDIELTEKGNEVFKELFGPS